VYLLLLQWPQTEPDNIFFVAVIAAVATLCWGLLALALSKSFPSVAQYAIVTVLVSASWSLLPPLLAFLTLGLQNSTQVAVGTAMAISIGNLGGYVGPLIMAISRERYNSYSFAAELESGFALGVCLGCFGLARYTARKTSVGYVALQTSERNTSVYSTYSVVIGA